MPLPKNNKIYTKKDLENLPENERWELIDGNLYQQAAPLVEHQEISVNLLVQIKNQLKSKICKVYHSPFELDLNEKQIYLPDLLIVCNNEKMSKRGYKGIPTFVAEILSPSTAQFDKISKLNAYQKAAIPEYWIIDPHNKLIDRFILNSNEYKMTTFTKENKEIKLQNFENLKIDLIELFDY